MSMLLVHIPNTLTLLLIHRGESIRRCQWPFSAGHCILPRCKNDSKSILGAQQQVTGIDLAPKFLDLSPIEHL